MDLLVLGGTAFLGRALTRAALDRGIAVTCLARGSAPVEPGATLVRADRDDEDGLAPVADRRWDAVIDLTRQPGQARRAVRDLQADHLVLVSSGNVYAHFDRPEQPEDSPLLDPLDGDVMGDMSTYGPAKVACEQAVTDGTASHTIIRSGLIGGAGDWSGRSGYYPWRFAHPTGGDVIMPPGDTPIALIDVEDLAAWIVHCAANRVQGIFNATGPTRTLAEVGRLAREVAGAEASPRHVTAEELSRTGVNAWMGDRSLPLWIDDPSWRWFSTLDTTAARAAGLVTRPMEQTLAAALAFEEERTGPRATGLTDAEEREVRTALG